MLRYLIPFDRFTIYSRLAPAELAARLSRRVGTHDFFSFNRPAEPYTGIVSEKGFRITPVTYGRNSFIPVIVGRFEPDGMMTRIDVHQRMMMFIIVFMAIWFSLPGFFFLAFVVSAISSGGGAPADVTPLLMLAFGLVLVNGGFWWEARHSKADLLHLFEASTEPVGYFSSSKGSLR